MRLLFLLTLLLSPFAQAEEIHDLYRSAEVLGMGGAATASVEGVDALYYNPAGLASNDKFGMHLTNAYAEASSSALEQLTKYSGLLGSTTGLSSFNAILGVPLFAKAQVAPTFLTGKLGISFIYDVEAFQYSVNQPLPTTLVGTQITYGAQIGYAYSKKFGGGSGKSRRMAKEWRVGIAGKFLFRRGGYFYLDPVDYLVYTTNYLGLINSKMGTFSPGFGVDLGTQYIMPLNKLVSWSAGAAIRDIGDTMFPSNQSAPIRQNLSLGTAVTYNSGSFSLTASYDLRNITQNVDFKMKNHFGVSMKLPIVSGYIGLNQLSFLSYGFAIDIWAVKVAAVYYSQELGATAGALPDGRYAATADVRLEF
ncbi:MAG: hypothetical protein KA715_10140 [Xanthomonadaceae bacterium]|nr:hypothetical protein [Xanthomonadaceae bacterium]